MGKNKNHYFPVDKKERVNYIENTDIRNPILTWVY